MGTVRRRAARAWLAGVLPALLLAAPTAAGVTPAPSGRVLLDRALPTLPGTPSFLRVDARGRDVAVVDVGPRVWRSRDGARSFATDDATGVRQCPQLAGPVDVAHTADGLLSVAYACTVASLHQHGTPGAFGTATGGLPTPVAANVDGTWLTVDRHVPGREWWVAHDLAGRGIASDLLVGRSDDNGTTWRIVVANPPTDAGAQQVPQRLADDGPNVMAPVAVDPRDPDHVAVVYSAESQQDAEQGHSADAVDSYEWDTGVYAVSSRDGGLTWTAATVVDTGQPAVGTGHDEYSDTAGWFPSVTWTADGTLYATYAMRAAHTTRWVAMLSRSLDGGQRWSRPIPVSAPGQQAFSPTIASDGHQVAMAWFGSATRDNEGADGRWRLVGATIRWPSNRSRPSVSRYDLTSTIRTGPMVPLGPKSARSWRNLDLSLDGTGRAWVPYALQQGATAQRRLLAWRY